MDHSGTTRPRASIVIVGYGRRDVTETCLESLQRALGDDLGKSWELVLVDNASPDSTLELFQAWSDRATVVPLLTNRNFSGGCNAGAAAAGGDVLVFLNNDTIVPPGALDQIVATASAPDVGAAGARLLYPDGTVQHAGVWMFREPTGTVVPYHLFHHEPGDLTAAAITVDVDCVTGACLAMPNVLFHELGGFDERYVNGWEDVDLCLRVRAAGRRIVYRGDAEIVHAEGATRGRQQGYSENAAIFYASWQRFLDDDLPSFRRIWGAGYGPPAAIPSGDADVIVDGIVSGLGPAAAHTRAVVAALEAVGRAPMAHDPVQIMICPRLTLDEWAPLQRAAGRTAAADTPHVDPLELETPVVPHEVGTGGAGVLVLLPTHDLALSRRLLGEARSTGLAITVAPSARTTLIEELVAELAPGTELLDPPTSEMLLEAYARSADLVIAADPADRWDRQALICAGTGAGMLVRPNGRAAAVLGPLAAPIGAAPVALAARHERHIAVRDRCAPHRVLEALLPVLAQ